MNYAKLTFSANKIPRIFAAKEELEAFFVRWILVKFPNKFRGTDKEIPGLIYELTTSEELSGLFNLARAGFTRIWNNKKFSNSKTVEEVKLQYIRQSDSVKAFASEKLLRNQFEKIQDDAMYDVYLDYCEAHKLEPEQPGRFKGVMKTIGYINERAFVDTVRDYYWIGLEIKSG